MAWTREEIILWFSSLISRTSWPRLIKFSTSWACTEMSSVSKFCSRREIVLWYTLPSPIMQLRLNSIWISSRWVART